MGMVGLPTQIVPLDVLFLCASPVVSRIIPKTARDLSTNILSITPHLMHAQIVERADMFSETVLRRTRALVVVFVSLLGVLRKNYYLVLDQ
jgi:hypothetical protein